MPDKETLRRILRENLTSTMLRVNSSLNGEQLEDLQDVLTRLGRNHQLPHWYQTLLSTGVLPNLDGKTVGSVVEMLFVAVLEKFTYSETGINPLSINPARGVDLPDIGLGIKSPSTNFCTSEPFFSAYERLLGNEYPVLVLLTNYQEAKAHPPLKLQITDWRYLEASELADTNLCGIALKHRAWLLEENEAWAQKIFRFLAFVNQSDWRARHLIKILNAVGNDEEVRSLIQKAVSDFEVQNRKRSDKLGELIPDEDLEAIQKILDVTPLHLGVIDACDNWVAEIQKDLARFPNENEWGRLIQSPLNGKIGMSFALQWRYNFGRLFGVDSDELTVETDII